MKGKLFLAFTLIILAVLCFAIYQKEDIIATGDEFYITLESVEPRSIGQGDYMILNYDYNPKKNNSMGRRVEIPDPQCIICEYAILNLSATGVVKGYTLANDKVIGDNQVLLKIKRHEPLKFVADTFFFQEGKAEMFSNAKYARFKHKDGEAILVSLHNKNFREIRHEDEDESK